MEPRRFIPVKTIDRSLIGRVLSFFKRPRYYNVMKEVVMYDGEWVSKDWLEAPYQEVLLPGHAIFPKGEQND